MGRHCSFINPLHVRGLLLCLRFSVKRSPLGLYFSFSLCCCSILSFFSLSLGFHSFAISILYFSVGFNFSSSAVLASIWGFVSRDSHMTGHPEQFFFLRLEFFSGLVWSGLSGFCCPLRLFIASCSTLYTVFWDRNRFLILRCGVMTEHSPLSRTKKKQR
jgi:hypothetical protein